MNQPNQKQFKFSLRWLIVFLFVQISMGACAHDMASMEMSSNSSVVPIAGTFSLFSYDNQLITEKSYKDQYKLIFFGYTHCTDICSKVMHDVKVAMRELGGDASLVQPIFVSLDSQRDSGQVIHDYLRQFDTRIVGLHGSQLQIEQANKSFHVFMKTRQTEHDYIIDHSAVLFLMKPDGQFAKLLSGDQPGHKLSDDLRAEFSQ